MQIQKISGVKIEAVVGCLPSNIVDNQIDCLELYGKEKLDTLIKATGFRYRAIADKGVSTLDLCVQAANNIFDNGKILKEEIGAVIFVTFTPHYSMPASSAMIQHKLGLSKGVLAFDVGHACSGYSYGLYLGATLAKQLNKKVLMLNGDIQSHHVSPLDKATYPILSDAGSATIIAPSKQGKEWDFCFYTDGSGSDSLFIKAGGSHSPTISSDHEFLEYGEDKRRNTDIFMDGFAIFKFVAMDVSKLLTGFMHNTNTTADDYNAFVPHQANMYMIGQLSKKIKLSDKMWTSGEKYGNSASSTVPVTIGENAAAKLKKSSRALLASFGGGLSAGVCSIYLDNKAYFKNILYK